jgi:hypothetical protein
MREQERKALLEFLVESHAPASALVDAICTDADVRMTAGGSKTLEKSLESWSHIDFDTTLRQTALCRAHP